MSHIIILSQIISIVMGFGLIVYTYFLYNKYGFRFIKLYFVYILLENIFLVSTFTHTYLRFNLFSGEQLYLINKIYGFVFNFLSLSLIVGLLFCFVLMVYQIQEFSINRKFYKSLWLLIFVGIVGYIIGIIDYLGNDNSSIMIYTNRGMVTSFHAIAITLTIFLLAKKKTEWEQGLRKVILSFGWFYLFFHFLNFVVLVLKKPPELKIYFQILYVIIVIAFNLFPFLWLQFVYSKYHNYLLMRSKDESIMARIIEKYQFSLREREIIELILEGLSNKEISQRLFISFHTVKNHIYNIYNKLGINSRSQLIHLILKNK